MSRIVGCLGWLGCLGWMIVYGVWLTVVGCLECLIMVASFYDSWLFGSVRFLGQLVVLDCRCQERLDV